MRQSLQACIKHRRDPGGPSALCSTVQAALPHLKPGSAIINCASVTAYMGYPELLPYATTKGAIISFTRSLASHLVERGGKHAPLFYCALLFAEFS